MSLAAIRPCAHCGTQLRARRGPRLACCAVAAVAVGLLLAATALPTELRRGGGVRAPTAATAFVPILRSSGAAATVVATILGGLAAAGPLPAFAEQESSFGDLEYKLSLRDQGIAKIEREKTKSRLSFEDIERLERDSLALAKNAEEAQLKKVEAEEQKQKELAVKAEKEEKLQIEKDEKAKKAQIDKDLNAELKRLEAVEKAAKQEARKTEAAEKQAAIAAERKEKMAAKSEAERVDAEERRETAVLDAVDKSERAIIAAADQYEQAFKAALKKAEEARVAATEDAEARTKRSVQRAEKLLVEAVQRSELAERKALADEEKADLKIINAAEQAEKNEIVGLERLAEVASSILGTLGTFLAPAAALLVYAVFASFISPQPEPCRGGEADAVRKKMGRPDRSKTAPPKLDPWTAETA